MVKALPRQSPVHILYVVINTLTTGVRKLVPHRGSAGEWFAPLSKLFHGYTHGVGEGYPYV